MKGRTGSLLLLGAVCALSLRAFAGDTLTQASTIDALIKGIYDGTTTFSELKKHGDFGIGTIDHLDGEVLALDGIFYQITSDGKVHQIPGTATTPLAIVTWFEADQTKPVGEAGTLAALEEWLDGQMGSVNYFYAVKIKGTFADIKVRSVPRQNPPYATLPEVVKTQAVFELKNVKGTLVGFRCPPYVKGINVPGYHFHFLTDDKQAGGHVLDCTITSGEAAWDVLDKLEMILPGTDAFQKADFSQHDAQAVKTVEKADK